MRTNRNLRKQDVLIIKQREGNERTKACVLLFTRQISWNVFVAIFLLSALNSIRVIDEDKKTSLFVNFQVYILKTYHLTKEQTNKQTNERTNKQTKHKGKSKTSKQTKHKGKVKKERNKERKPTKNI